MFRPDTTSLSSCVREEAQRLGFFKVGITRIGLLPYDDHFERWLTKGWHGEMRYLERQAAKRRNPGLVLPNARSMLVLAMDYYAQKTLPDISLRGVISRYAQGNDYHKIVLDRLKALLRFIQNCEPSALGKCFVDTGPVMEKVWGAQTSLGWIGKHTNLITRERGSWFFIGVILLDIELEYDAQEKDFCGTCGRCMKACPTRAITAPYVLDPRLCISYLTIEFRDLIPRRLRPLMGNRIFGCDDCQQVCPWNRFAVETSVSELAPNEKNIMPELVPLVRITPQEFDRRFRHSPIRRATRDGLVRNAAIALGNSHRSEAVRALEEALQDGSPVVRAAAAWALGQISSGKTTGILQRARSRETDRLVLEEIAIVLA